jgi:hypothetical protein
MPCRFSVEALLAKRRARKAVVNGANGGGVAAPLSASSLRRRHVVLTVTIVTATLVVAVYIPDIGRVLSRSVLPIITFLRYQTLTHSLLYSFFRYHCYRFRVRACAIKLSLTHSSIPSFFTIATVFALLGATTSSVVCFVLPAAFYLVSVAFYL